MLTRLRIRGFKNLYDVDLCLGPFTCILGKNASGKSNLFDALSFLQLLTRFPIAKAASRIQRGSGARSLFTAIGQRTCEEMSFELDLLFDPKVLDAFGVTAEASTTAVRYEVRLGLMEEDGVFRIALLHESLVPRNFDIVEKELSWSSGSFRQSVLKGKIAEPFIWTQSGKVEARAETSSTRRMTFTAKSSMQTALHGLASSEFPTLLAVGHEIASWQNLALEPSALREPSPLDSLDLPAVTIDRRGAYLAAVVERIRQREERPGQTYSELANRLSEMVDDVKALRVQKDRANHRLVLEAQGRDGVFRPAGSLSDGTLRILAIAALSLDSRVGGLLALEEPENGVHPERMQGVVQLLRDIAVDPELSVDSDNPLRQVLITTHSPAVVRSMASDELVHIREATIVEGPDVGRVATLTFPQGSWRSQGLATAPGDLEAYEKKPLSRAS
jgi:predicted ATPase